MSFFLQNPMVWPMAVAAICSAACSLLGAFLVLRRLSMLGDAISHGMLPGIILAVLFTGTITSLALFAGAMVFGLATALLIQFLCNLGHLTEDASQGVVSTSLFALGIFLLSAFFPHTDLDLDCVFFGQLEHWWGTDVPEILPTLLTALGITVGFLVLFWKELKLATFDPGLASAMGFSAPLLHYPLIALVAGVTVISLETFGVVLVVAMLVVPAATALLWTDRLVGVLLIALGTAVLSCFLGILLGSRQVWDCNLGGMISVTAGGLFLLSVLFAPQHGLLVRWLRHLQLALRMAAEDILANLYRAEENQTLPAPLFFSEHGLSTMTIRWALQKLQKSHLVRFNDTGLPILTEQGRQEASRIIRAHRLWEVFLEQNLNLPIDHLHPTAAQMEHFLGPRLQEELEKELLQPALDPHGKAIPPQAEGS